MRSCEPDPAVDTAELARTVVTSLVAGDDKAGLDDLVSPTCVVHLDGASFAWSDVRCLTNAYRAVFPAMADVVQVATWRDVAMIAYIVRHIPIRLDPDPCTARAFPSVTGGRVVEMWLVDDWSDWLARHDPPD